MSDLTQLADDLAMMCLSLEVPESVKAQAQRYKDARLGPVRESSSAFKQVMAKELPHVKVVDLSDG